MKLIILSGASDGGICHYTYCLAEALQAQGEDVTVLINNLLPYELANLPHKHKVKRVLSVGLSPIGRLLIPLRNAAVLLKEANGTKVIHYQWPIGPRNDRIHWRLLHFVNKRIVYTAHDVIPHEPGTPLEKHTRWLHQQADTVIVHGTALKKLLIETAGIASERVNAIPHGNYNFVADRYSKWNRQGARTSFGWSERERAILFFGQIFPYKGLDTLIAACGLIKSKEGMIGERLRLLIAGRPSTPKYWDEAGFTRQIEEAGLRNQTICITEYIPIEELARYFLAADVVALPYKSGSQSGILQLAYAFSKPVLVTDVGSISEVVQNGTTGIIVSPNDPAALADALTRLLINQEVACRMGAGGRAYSENELSWEKIAKKTQIIYDDMIKR